MRINRLELLGLLKTLSPAVANTKNQVAELSHIWFHGDKVSAFDDVLGIEIAFPTEFTGGVLGEKLLGVVERSRAKEVTIEAKGEDALLKIGSANFKLTRRPIEDCFWQPQVPDGDGYVMTKEFREAVSLSLVSVGSTSVLNPEQRGITVVQNGKNADLYSTDAVSMSWTRIDTTSGTITDTDRLILPTQFCEQLKGVRRAAELRFDEGAVYCLMKVDPLEVGGSKKPEEGETRQLYDVLVFSKLVEDEDDPVSFADVVKEHSTDQTVDIPSQLKIRVERAMVLLTDEPVDLFIEDNQLYLYARTPYGEVDDVMKIAGHPDVAVKIDVRLLHRVLDGRDKMSVAENGVVVTGPANFIHIISTK